MRDWIQRCRLVFFAQELRSYSIKRRCTGLGLAQLFVGAHLMRDCGSAWLDGLFRARVALPQKPTTETATEIATETLTEAATEIPTEALIH